MSPARTADFRSDTVTRPSEAMRAAMASAEVGDDVLDGDPTVRHLEAFAAEWLGMEAALFVPSGTMANQVALGVWTRPGDEIIAESESHILRWEGGAAGANHGVQSLTLQAERGVMTDDQIRGALRPDFIHCARTGLLCLEQTNMGGGGSVLPLEAIDGPARIAREAGVPVHLDGARLANAVAASGIAAKRWTEGVDSVSLCLSKGLGAPVGSVIAGSADFAERGRHVRKRLGGWMRQSGILAAAGLMALEQNVERLAQDHEVAQALARGFNVLEGLHCPPEDSETNIVMVHVVPPAERPDFPTAAQIATRLGPEGVAVMALSRTTLRFVTHLDVGLADVELAVAAMQRVLSA